MVFQLVHPNNKNIQDIPGLAPPVEGLGPPAAGLGPPVQGQGQVPPFRKLLWDPREEW